MPGMLNLLLQHAESDGGWILDGYLSAAENLLSPYDLHLKNIDLRGREFPWPQKSVDPILSDEIAGVRVAAEKQTPGMTNLLRVIFCRFPFSRSQFKAITDGGSNGLATRAVAVLNLPEFVLVNVGSKGATNNVLIHEMIHATGIGPHDPDPTSVFAEGASGTILKPEHAECLRKSFFAVAKG